MHHFDTSSTSSSSEDEVIIVRRKKVYKERKNYMELYDTDFYDRFRLHKPTVAHILQQIQHIITLRSNRGGSISPIIQLLLSLRFFALGDMQIAVADFIGISRASASRIIERVSAAIASLCPQYINMPNGKDELERSATEFYGIASFPKVIGAIDCTLIKIDSPGGHGEIFRCRKSFFAINVQTVSDTKLKIRNIVARWPGSTHDQTIFNNSNLKRDFEMGNFGRYILIGDSTYALQPYLMTPLQQTRTAAENLYNESIIRTRNVVERQYGVWKRRFPILRLGMRLKLNTVLNVIVATAVLHNIAMDMSEEVPINWLQDIQEDDVEIGEGNNVYMARHYRQLLIDEHFARLL